MSWWYSLLASPVLVAAIPYVRQLAEWFATRRSQKALQVAQEVYQHLNEAQFRLDSDRILIISAHNCGGSIRPDVLLYVDALYELVADLEPRLTRIVNVRADQYLIQLLSKLTISEKEWVKVGDVPAGTYVRNLYDTDGVTMACTFHIGCSDKRMLYGVVHWKLAHEPTPKENDAIDVLRSTLAKLMG